MKLNSLVYTLTINYLFCLISKTKCLKAMNLFKIIAHQTWGADQSTLLTLYRTLIRSKLDYGAIAYNFRMHQIFTILVILVDLQN